MRSRSFLARISLYSYRASAPSIRATAWFQLEIPILQPSLPGLSSSYYSDKARRPLTAIGWQMGRHSSRYNLGGDRLLLVNLLLQASIVSFDHLTRTHRIEVLGER